MHRIKGMIFFNVHNYFSVFPTYHDSVLFFNVLAPFERVNKYVIFSIYTEEVTGTDHEYEAK